MRRLLVSQEDLIEIGKHYRATGEYYVSGSYSIYCPGYDVKYMNTQVVRPWPDLEGERIPMLPGEAARTELKREFPDIRKVGWSGPMVTLFDKRVPTHYTGPAAGPMVLIDLRSAYWQIYRLLWLDVCYPGGYFGKFPLLHVAERLKDWKAARNAVVGIARQRTAEGVKGDRRIKLYTTNYFLSPGLWATVQDTLHWIATCAISCGAIYVNTDGYIFPETEHTGHTHFTNWLDIIGFNWEIRGEGEGEIVSWNNYKVGRKTTKPYRLGLIHKTKEFSNVRETKYTQWEEYYQRLRSLIRSSNVE